MFLYWENIVPLLPLTLKSLGGKIQIMIKIQSMEPHWEPLHIKFFTLWVELQGLV